MTETPPEQPLPDPDVEDDDQVDDVDEVDDDDPERDADGVTPDRLSKVGIYDTAEQRYVGTYRNKTEAKKDDRLKGKGSDRYVLRRV